MRLRIGILAAAAAACNRAAEPKRVVLGTQAAIYERLNKDCIVFGDHDSQTDVAMPLRMRMRGSIRCATADPNLGLAKIVVHGTPGHREFSEICSLEVHTSLRGAFDPARVADWITEPALASQVRAALSFVDERYYYWVRQEVAGVRLSAKQTRSTFGGTTLDVLIDGCSGTFGEPPDVFQSDIRATFPRPYECEL